MFVPFLCFYGRFRSTRIMTTATIATNTNSPTMAGIKYWSATEGDIVGAGVAVGAASETANAVVAEDGQ